MNMGNFCYFFYYWMYYRKMFIRIFLFVFILFGFFYWNIVIFCKNKCYMCFFSWFICGINYFIIFKNVDFSCFVINIYNCVIL